MVLVCAGPIGVYFEPAAVIVTLVLLGQVLELRARSQTSSAIKALLGLAPKTARVIRPGGAEEDVRSTWYIPATFCACGRASASRWTAWCSTERARGRIHDHWRTDPGGEGGGARVTGGTVNGTGAFAMRAERVGAETMLARIVQMVSEAQRSRAPIQRLADRVSAWFVPAVIAAAVVTFMVWAIVGTRAAAGVRARERGRGADHRVPLRVGAGNADVHYGWNGARGDGGRADPKRRSARSLGKSGHPGGGQDRHAHRGQAEARLCDQR